MLKNLRYLIVYIIARARARGELCCVDTGGVSVTGTRATTV